MTVSDADGMQIRSTEGLIRALPVYEFFGIPMSHIYATDAENKPLYPGDEIPEPYVIIQLTGMYLRVDTVPQKIKEFLNDSMYLFPKKK